MMGLIVTREASQRMEKTTSLSMSGRSGPVVQYGSSVKHTVHIPEVTHRGILASADAAGRR